MKTFLAVLCTLIASLSGGACQQTNSPGTRTTARDIQSKPGRPYTVANQPPITEVPSPASLFAKRLPGDIMSHLMANDVALAVHALDACSSSGICSTNISFHHVNSNEVTEVPTYYGTASDPVYVLRSAGHAMTGAYNPIGVPFHCRQHAQFSSGSSDQYFLCWDQTTNKVISMFCYGSRGCQARQFPSCSSTDPARPCDIGFSVGYAMINNFDDPRGYGIGPWNPYASIFLAAPVGQIRVQELMQGHIYHALYLNTLCQRGAPVFPDIFNWATAYQCNSNSGPNTDIAPPAGALVFLDYSDAQLALLKNYMPAWQYPIVEALTHYGGYVGDTGNPLHPSRLEGEEAYLTDGMADPIFSWLHGQAGINSGCGPSGTCNLPWANFAVAGQACPAAGLCDITQHIHIADPCVAEAMAGLSASQGACF